MITNGRVAWRLRREDFPLIDRFGFVDLFRMGFRYLGAPITKVTYGILNKPFKSPTLEISPPRVTSLCSFLEEQKSFAKEWKFFYQNSGWFNSNVWLLYVQKSFPSNGNFSIKILIVSTPMFGYYMYKNRSRVMAIFPSKFWFVQPQCLVIICRKIICRVMVIFPSKF